MPGKDQSSKTILMVAVLTVLVFGLFFVFGKRTKEGVPPETVRPTQRPLPDISGTPEKGEIGYQEPDTTVEVGTKEVSDGNFDRVEGGKIYFGGALTLTELPLTSEEVSVACTTQSLSGIKELDYDLITKINIFSPSEVGEKIPEGEPIVVFATVVDGVLKAHTIVIASTSCPS